MERIDVLEINSVNFGSTGGIMLNIADMANKEGIKTVVAYPLQRDNYKKHKEGDIYIGNRILRNLHLLFSTITGLNGCFSFFSTLNFIWKLKRIKPRVIHFHNLHNCYINLPLLFWFVKQSNISVIWTLHDCWPFTGQCPYFTISQCERWRYGCRSCTQYMNYPKSLIDNTRLMWKLKKRWFSGVERLTIVTPSVWLSKLVSESFLKHYPVKVINNGIDLSIFKPSHTSSKLCYGIPEDNFVLLGVSSYWSERKGLDVFFELRKLLPSYYTIILVGINKKIKTDLPIGIIGIDRTHNASKLAEIYSMADIFINPTREENYPTVNIESIACGTPVITFNTGGSPEILNKHTGIVTKSNTPEAIIDAISEMRANMEMYKITIEDTLSYAKEVKLQQYIDLYKSLM